jgi:hypothetical protein
MNWKLIIVGAIVFVVTTFIVGFAVTGPLIHNGILMPVYTAHPEFWRPELNQTPPNMMALMPYLITTGLIGALIIAAIYGQVRSTFSGTAWLRGLKYGFVVFLLSCTFSLGYSVFFNLPLTIWVWWGVDALITYLIAGAVLGWVAQKVAPLG